MLLLGKLACRSDGRWRARTCREESRANAALRLAWDVETAWEMAEQPGLFDLHEPLRRTEQERGQGEQPEQCRGGAGDRRVRPLPLGLDSQVVADLGEGDLHGPTLNAPAQHHERIGLQVGAQQALRLEGAVRIVHQNPADRNLLAGVLPQGHAGSDVQLNTSISRP